MPLDVFLQEHGKTIFIAVCILLLVGVAYVIGPIISNAVKDVADSYNGVMETRLEKGVFAVSVLIPLNNTIYNIKKAF